MQRVVGAYFFAVCPGLDARNLAVRVVQPAQPEAHRESGNSTTEVSAQKVSSHEPEIKPVKGHGATEDVRPVNETLATEVKSSQSLLVCNAYNKLDGATMLLNGKDDLTAEKSLKYKECRYFDAKLANADKLNFSFEDGAGGTFEVAGLPSTDSVLLLILERRDADSNLLAFQSYAFPKALQNSAQVAVIDAYKGKEKSAVLTMEDHVVIRRDGRPLLYQRVRLEELEFNKVYSVEAGEYDADISFEDFATKEKKHTNKRMIKFENSKNYVIMRTGLKDDQELIAFPGVQSSAALFCLAGLALIF